MCNWFAKETAKGKTKAMVAGLDITAVINFVTTKSKDIAATGCVPLTRHTHAATHCAAPDLERARPIAREAINNTAKSKSKAFFKSLNLSVFTTTNTSIASDVAINKSNTCVIPKTNSDYATKGAILFCNVFFLLTN